MTTGRSVRRRPAGRSRGERRRNLWASASIEQDILGNGATAVFALINPSLSVDLRLGTVVRIRGRIIVRNVSTSNFTAGRGLIAGMIVVQEDAFAVGSTAVPDPDNDTIAPWLWWSPLFTQGNGSNDATEAFTFEIDVKAARKLPGNSVLAFVARNRFGSAVDFVLYVRMLIKLH